MSNRGRSYKPAQSRQNQYWKGISMQEKYHKEISILTQECFRLTELYNKAQGQLQNIYFELKRYFDGQNTERKD